MCRSIVAGNNIKEYLQYNQIFVSTSFFESSVSAVLYHAAQIANRNGAGNDYKLSQLTVSILEKL